MIINDVYKLEGMETQHAIDTDVFQLQAVFNDMQSLCNKGNQSLMKEHARVIEILGRELQVMGQYLKECV